MSNHNNRVLRLVDFANNTSGDNEISRLSKENENLKAQLRALQGHTIEHDIYRKVLKEIKISKPIKGVWLP